ncbi:MAG: peptidase U32 family protein [bacterium]
MKRAELLLPAGNTEKMQYAMAYGADAVYLGTADFSLRSPKTGNIITNENIKNSIEIAHSMGAKAYVTLNVFPNNEIIEKLPPLMELLADASPDGIIFADPAFYSFTKRYLPNVPIHISTQANVLNYESAKFWQDLGATRIILARELSLKEIEQIAVKVPDIELEALVHGSMCVAYSGRCLLSDYMTNNTRKSNQGACAQPCRWTYKLIESKRPDDEYEITEDQHGTYILNPKDLSLIEYIPDLINAGVSSFKIEGRTKSMYYAALVAKTYKKALNAFYDGNLINIEEFYEELFNIGNRGLTTGFLLERPDSSHYDYKASKSTLKSVFQAIILEKVENNIFKIKAKNQLKSGEIVDFITPTSCISTEILEIINKFEEKVEVTNTNDEVCIKLNIENSPEDWKWGIIRQKEQKNNAIKTETHLYS